VPPRDAVAWIAGSLGMPGASSARDMLERFDAKDLPRRPTVF
jgi:hypothetical protein